MSRDERTRSLPLLDRETAPGGGREKRDIGSELFGIRHSDGTSDIEEPAQVSEMAMDIQMMDCETQMQPLERLNDEALKPAYDRIEDGTGNEAENIRISPSGDDSTIKPIWGKAVRPQGNVGYGNSGTSQRDPLPDTPPESMDIQQGQGLAKPGILPSQDTMQEASVHMEAPKLSQPGIAQEISLSPEPVREVHIGNRSEPAETPMRTGSQEGIREANYDQRLNVGDRFQGQLGYPQNRWDDIPRMANPERPDYSYPKLAKPDVYHKNCPKKLISVYSPKGGVGKSTISKELATAYSTAVVNGDPVQVLLVDADWEFGDVTTLFNVAPRPNVTDWVRDMQADKRKTGYLHLFPDDIIRTRYTIPYSNTLHILAGPGDPVEAELITEEMVLAIVESLKRSNYDIVIFDSANSNRARSLLPLMKSDAVVLVETLDTSTVAETTAVLNTLRSKQFDFGKLYMVLNQVPENDAQIDISVAEISRLLQLDVAAVLPKYELIRMINNAGEAAVRKRATAYSQAMFQLANRIVPLFDGKKKHSFLRFLDRLRGGKR